MRTLLVVLLVLVTTSCEIFDHRGPGVKAGHDVVVCHKGKTMSLPEEAASAHINHGDTYGPC